MYIHTHQRLIPRHFQTGYSSDEMACTELDSCRSRVYWACSDNVYRMVCRLLRKQQEVCLGLGQSPKVRKNVNLCVGHLSVVYLFKPTYNDFNH